MTHLSFTAQLRLIDDADLDPYQFRMLIHVWRVGKCFESLRTTAEKCGMSLGKASEVRQWLIGNGWIELVPYAGKMAVTLCSLHEHCSLHEQERSPHEQMQPENVHVVNAILNEPNTLNEPLLNEGGNFSPKTELPEPFEPEHLRFMPEYIATEEMIEKWTEWEYSKMESGKPLTSSTAKRQLADCAKWGVDRAIAAIELSLTKGWVGLSEDKFSTNGKAPAADPYFADIKPVGGLY